MLKRSPKKVVYKYKLIYDVVQPTRAIDGSIIEAYTRISVYRLEGWFWKTFEILVAFKLKGTHHFPDTLYIGLKEVNDHLESIGVRLMFDRIIFN